MTAETPAVSVIVLNHNGERWLERCLASLAAQDSREFEVVVVDNASADASRALLRDRLSWARVVELDENLGFAAGNNAGARAARGRLLAFLNNDTEADAGWIAALRRALETHPEAGLATSRIVYLHDRALLDSAGDGYARWGGAFKRGHGQPASRYASGGEVFGACGAAFMIRREVFDELGGFDEDFFLVYEDVDLSYRAQLGGHRCLYVPGALVAHAGSGTMGAVSRTAVFHGQRNLEWVYVKNTPWPLLLRSLPGHLVYSLAGGIYLASAGHLRTWLAAKWAALSGLRSVLRKRRAIQRARRTDSWRLWRLMEPKWLALKWREKRFDLQSAGTR